MHHLIKELQSQITYFISLYGLGHEGGAVMLPDFAIIL